MEWTEQPEKESAVNEIAASPVLALRKGMETETQIRAQGCLLLLPVVEASLMDIREVLR